MAALKSVALASVRPKLRCVIMPGNGCSGNLAEINWYGWLANELREREIFDEVVLPKRMPDPNLARESVWVPFMRDTLRCDANTVVVGHSSGAEAAMRLLETTELFGVALVSACHTDLGDDSERAAGYYDRPWLWDDIRANAANFVLQFHGDDDPFIPLSEARFVAQQLRSEYHELHAKSHFFSPPFPELVEALARRCAAPKARAPVCVTPAARTILGFGSLLSEASSRTTFPDLTNFRLVRVRGWRRVFAHAAAIFFERGIADAASGEFASLSAERDDDASSEGFLVAAFEVTTFKDQAAWALFEEREEEFDLVQVPFEDLQSGTHLGHGVLCTRSSDAQYVARWGKRRHDEKYGAVVDSIWDWTPGSRIRPCAVYLRHCVLAATKAGDTALDSFLDDTFLVDRATPLRAYLAENPHVMQTRPPPSLEARYSG